MPIYGWVLRIEYDQDGDYVVMSPSITALDIEEPPNSGPLLQIAVQPLGMITNGTDPAVELLIQETWEKDTGAIWRALATSLLVMHTEGVEREVIECSKMNRKRQSNGKRPIPDHTYLRIGKVYRSHFSLASDEYVARKSPRPHWRKGHIRHLKRGDIVRKVYINPRLIAWRDYMDAPKANKEYVVSK
jgi:hypothetical protein